MKLSISLNDELVSKVDEIAKSNYMTRSGFISTATVNYLNQLQVVEKFNEMNRIMTKLYEKGMLEEKDMDDLGSIVEAMKVIGR